MSVFSKDIRDSLDEACIRIGIKSVQDALQPKANLYNNLIDLAGMVYENSGIQCLKLSQEFSSTSLQKIISNVKNKLIFILLDLEKKFGNLDSLDVDVESIDTAEMIGLNKSITDRIFYDGISEEITN